MMQNSGLGNAVSPLTSLTWTFRLPQLLIVTWRGQPGVADEPQHALMGPITPAMLDHHGDPVGALSGGAAGAWRRPGSARAHLSESGRPYALVMPKGCVAPYALEAETRPARRAAPARAVSEPHRHAPMRGRRGARLSRRSSHIRRSPRPSCSPRPDFAGESCMRSPIGPINSTWSDRWDASRLSRWGSRLPVRI